MAINKGNNPDIMEEKRRRSIAIIKASNQMLREAKETAMKHITDPVRRSELDEEFDTAINENKIQAKNMLNATEEDIEKSQFREADKSYVDKYNEHLRKRGITDEQVHQKEIATVVTTDSNKKEKETVTRRKRRGATKDIEGITRVENEDEIMKATMVKDEHDIEEQKKKNFEYEQKNHKKRHDLVEKAKEAIKETAEVGKVKLKDPFENERVEVKTREQEDTRKNESKSENKVITTHHVDDNVTYDFDFGSIPSWVQYDVIPLPSNGQCYSKESPLRCGHVPVAYLTASDENIIASPNVYRDGKLLDIILERKILDKRIDVSTISSGDKDAIILWLRATSYGEDFPISVTNPTNGKQYNVTIKLSQFKYLDFDLKGDENGLFDYETSNGDKIKFKFFTSNDEKELRKIIGKQVTDLNRLEALREIRNISEALSDIDITDEERSMCDEDITELKDIIGDKLEEKEDIEYPSTVTQQMIMHTVSINGNRNEEYIQNYMENMRTREALNYRNAFINNKPGVDFNFTVNVPESDGGGSFNSFLRIDDTIFLNF